MDHFKETNNMSQRNSGESYRWVRKEDETSSSYIKKYTTRENLAAWYNDFQTMGGLTVQWIQAAQRQTLQLGYRTGWDGEGWQGAHLKYPEHCLITSGTSENGGSDVFSDMDSKDSISGLGAWSDEELPAGNSGEGEKRIVLHPAKSAYATCYPNFDPFNGQTHIDNGYVDNYNNLCRAMIIHPAKPEFAPIDYANTLFTPCAKE